MSSLLCRLCSAPLERTFADLGVSPLANAFLSPSDLAAGERFYPLRAYVCASCYLVQLPPVASPEELFSDYAYFSSYSESWLRHAESYAAAMVERLGLGPESRVVEVASNDGYLLRYFRERGIAVLGVEPAANVARAAQEAGIPTRIAFFGSETAGELAAEGLAADLLVGNNVLAHVPDLHDFVAGLKALLKPGGAITMEFPHLLRLMEENQFDTIYHEHLSYFSLRAAERAFAAGDLCLFDVEELPTHGGSLRVYARHAGDAGAATGERVTELLAREEEAGLGRLETYLSFGERIRETKRRLLAFLIDAKEAGKTIAGYGAPAKGNTLLNYCGIGPDFLDYTVDRSPHKQGRFLPGSRLPIHPPERLLETRPDLVFILPWNLKEEVMDQMAAVRSWGSAFFVAIPRLEVLP